VITFEYFPTTIPYAYHPSSSSLLHILTGMVH